MISFLFILDQVLLLYLCTEGSWWYQGRIYHTVLPVCCVGIHTDPDRRILQLAIRVDCIRILKATNKFPMSRMNTRLVLVKSCFSPFARTSFLFLWFLIRLNALTCTERVMLEIRSTGIAFEPRKSRFTSALSSRCVAVLIHWSKPITTATCKTKSMCRRTCVLDNPELHPLCKVESWSKQNVWLTLAVWKTVESRKTSVAVPASDMHFARTLSPFSLTDLVQRAVQVAVTFEAEGKVVISKVTPDQKERVFFLCFLSLVVHKMWQMWRNWSENHLKSLWDLNLIVLLSKGIARIVNAEKAKDLGLVERWGSSFEGFLDKNHVREKEFHRKAASLVMINSIVYTSFFGFWFPCQQ